MTRNLQKSCGASGVVGFVARCISQHVTWDRELCPNRVLGRLKERLVRKEGRQDNYY